MYRRKMKTLIWKNTCNTAHKSLDMEATTVSIKRGTGEKKKERRTDKENVVYIQWNITQP